MMKDFARLWPLACLLAAPALAEDLDRLIDGELSGLVSNYKEIHAHPELSHREEKTAALLASELRKAGYKVTERVGKSVRHSVTPLGAQLSAMSACAKSRRPPRGPER